MELKFYKHGAGACQKCGADSGELYKAVVSAEGRSKDFILCKKCSLDLKRSVERKNAEEKVNNQNSVVDTTEKFCGKCGAKLEAGELFCGNCGNPVNGCMADSNTFGYDYNQNKDLSGYDTSNIHNFRKTDIGFHKIYLRFNFGAVIAAITALACAFCGLELIFAWSGVDAFDNIIPMGVILLIEAVTVAFLSVLGFKKNHSRLIGWLFMILSIEQLVSPFLMQSLKNIYDIPFFPVIIFECISAGFLLFESFAIGNYFRNKTNTKDKQIIGFGLAYFFFKLLSAIYIVFVFCRSFDALSFTYLLPLPISLTMILYLSWIINPKKDFDKKTKKTRIVKTLISYLLALLILAGIATGSFFAFFRKAPVVYNDNCRFETVTFGNYGGDDIEWLVLDEQNGKKLLISKYVLDNVPYDDSYNVNWEDCDLRQWLNGEFYNSAFSENEKHKIIYTAVKNHNCDETDDRIFLLECDEVENYFRNSVECMCKPTEYASANGVYNNWVYNTTYWRLRYSDNANSFPDDYSLFPEECVTPYGEKREYYSMSEYNIEKYGAPDGVRPAMWVELGDNSSYYNTNTESSTESKGLFTSTTNSPKIKERSFQLGSYPQTKVNDSYLIGSLNNCNIVWKSLDYYAGDNDCDGTMKAYDIAYYADVDYNGEKYRAVRLDEYRPSLTSAKRVGTVPDDNTNQPKNSYYTGNVYWFKFEPITWTVLDESSGLAITDLIIDAQPFTNYIYKGSDDCYYGSNGEFSNNWEDSYLREWLNGDFYNTAFTYSEKSKIKSTYVDNSFINGTDYGYNRSSTYDNVFVLSYEELTNSHFGFDSDYSAHDNARSAFGTDYARSQNLDIFRSENVDQNNDSQFVGRSYFGTRTVGKGTRNICYVDARGYIQNFDYVHDTSCGVRPAICINN